MSKITCFIATTIDGFIADELGGVSFLDNINDSGDDYGYTKFFDSVDAVIMGSKTYEQILSFGGYPYANKKSFVITHRVDELKALTTFQDTIEWPIEFFGGDIGPIIDKLRNDGRYEHLWLVGGGSLVKQLIELGVLDELRIFVVPTLLGKGIPLFDQVNSFRFFTLLETITYAKGVVELHYDLRR